MVVHFHKSFPEGTYQLLKQMKTLWPREMEIDGPVSSSTCGLELVAHLPWLFGAGRKVES